MFENFSKINYYLNGQTLELTDIFKSIKVDTTNSPDISTTKNINFERPDQLSNNLYNDPKLFWVNLALNNIKNPFKEWARSNSTQLTQNSTDFDTKIFQFANNSNYLPTNSEYFNSNEIDSYSGVSLSGIQQDDIIIFETGAGPLELKTYGAGIVSALNSCGYPHFGQSDIPDNFLNRNNIIQISCGRNFTACLDDLGYIWAWGEDIGLESSGFNLNGRLYNSPSGGYKHIDTTHDKIIAVTSTGDFVCFGNCANFTFTGQSDIKKSSWTSGQTFAGIGIKNDNTISIFGPIVSTNATIQYFSDVSCADDYCLGAATGAVNGVVVGFGSTGYFEQIRQNTFYSKELTKLGALPQTNPIYPFTDTQNKIVKQYNKNVLQVSIKDIPPFTSPTQNPEEVYRSNYIKIFGSNSDDRILFGFTDHNSNSREGFILNNPKIFALYGFDEFSNNNFDYSFYYNKILKPKKISQGFAGLFDRNYIGITALNKMVFTAVYVQGLTGPVDFYNPAVTCVPAFYPQFKSEVNTSNSTYNTPVAPLAQNNVNGVTYIVKSSSLGDIFSNNLRLKNGEGIKNIQIITDGEIVLLLKEDDTLDIFSCNREINYQNKYTTDVLKYLGDPSTELRLQQTLTCVGINGITYTYDKELPGILSTINAQGISYISSQSGRSAWVITKDGTPYRIHDPNESEIYGNAADFYAFSDFVKSYPAAVNPPSGISFIKIENADGYSYWAAGLAKDNTIKIWGITYITDIKFGFTGDYYTIPGITASDITVNWDNVVAIHGNNTLSIHGNYWTEFIGNLGPIDTFENMFAGFTVSNAAKVVGPYSVIQSLNPFGDGKQFKPDETSPIFVLTKSNEVLWAHLGGTAGNLIKNAGGITLYGWAHEQTTQKYTDNEILNLLYRLDKRTDVSEKIKTGVVDIVGNGNQLYVTKNDNSLIKIVGHANTTPLLDFPSMIYRFAHFLNGVELGFKPLIYSGFEDALLLYNSTTKQILYPYFILNIHIPPPYDYMSLLAWSSTFGQPFTFFDYYVYIQKFNSYGGKSKHYIDGAFKPNEFNYRSLIPSSYTVDDFLYGNGLTLENVFPGEKYGFSFLAANKETGKKNNIGYILRGTGDLNRFDAGTLGPVKDEIEDIIFGNGFMVLLQKNKKITLINADKVPYNTTKFNNFITSSFSSEPFSYNDFIGDGAVGGAMAYGIPVTSEGSLKIWGLDGSLTSPPGLTYSFIDCFYTHCCGIKENGLVECWGMPQITTTNENGVYKIFDVPSTLGIANKLSVGYDHNCAEDINGNIICWGNNDYAQCSVPAEVNDGSANKIIDCGQYFTALLKQDGRLFLWGSGTTGSGTINILGSSIPTTVILET